MLNQQNCVPCTGNEPPLTADEIETLRLQTADWGVSEVKGVPRLQRAYSFSSYMSALRFAMKVGEMAEDQGHHPRLIVDWKKTTVEWWTHAIRGLHQNDFIMAAKTDDLYQAWGDIIGEKDVVEEAVEESFPASDPPSWTAGRETAPIQADTTASP